MTLTYFFAVAAVVLLFIVNFNIVVLALEFYLLLVYTLIRLNRGNFVIGPVGVYMGYFTLYIFLPSLLLYLLKIPGEIGLATGFFVDERSIALISLSMAGFLLGALLLGKGTSGAARLTDNSGLLGGQRLCLYGMVVLGFALSSVYIIQNFSALTHVAAGSFSDHYVDVQQFKTETMYGASLFLQGMNQILPIVVLFLFAHSYYYGKPRRLAKFLLVVTVMFHFLTGGLWVGFSVVVPIVLLRAYFIPESRKNIARYGISLAVVVLAALAAKYGFSADDNGGWFLVFHRFSSGARQLQFTLDNEHSYEYGFTYIRDVIALIPSIVKRPLFPEEYWSGFNGLMFYRMFGFYGGTAQVPLVGEFYMNGGALWVFLGSILHGAAVQRISNLLRHQQVKTTFGVVAAVVIGYRLGESSVEGFGTRLFVSLLWLGIFYAVIRLYGVIVELAISREPGQISPVI